MKNTTIATGFLVLAAVCAAYALTPEEKERNAKFQALKKEGADLLKGEFKRPFADYSHEKFDAACALYEKGLSEDFTVIQKVELLNLMAQSRLDGARDVEGAKADLDKAVKLAEGDEAAKALALKNRQELNALLDGSAFGPPPASINWNLSYHAPHPETPGEGDGPVAAQIGRLYREGGLENLQRALPAFLATRAQDTTIKKNRPYTEAWRWFTSYLRSRETNGIMQQPEARACVLAIMDKAPAGDRPSEADLFAMADADFLRHPETAAKFGTALLAKAKADPNAKIKPELLTKAAFCVDYASAGNDLDKLLKAIRRDDRAEWAGNLARAASCRLACNDESSARKIWEERAKIVPSRQSELQVPYWADAPHDLRGILESPRYKAAAKGALSRPYGDNLKMLIETDSAIVGREMTTAKGEKFRPTELFAFWDEFGVKILLRAYIDNMAEVKAGYAGAGGYETYLATGIDDPYHCVMISPNEGAKPSTGFVTQYENGLGYRSFGSENSQVQLQNLYLDDGVASLMSVPWTAAFMACPWARDAWYFEALHWAHGGMSWGGSTSVHHRSAFGKLVFTGVNDASCAAVKRRLLLTAKAVLKKSLYAGDNGYAEMWADPDLGDQDFWNAEVKPLVDRLQAALAVVGKDMTDDDAVKAWDAAGEDAMNINYVVARKRAEWLDAKRVSGK